MAPIIQLKQLLTHGQTLPHTHSSHHLYYFEAHARYHIYSTINISVYGHAI